MDVHLLYLSCRTGDLEGVRCAVEQRDVDVNIRDRWDSTPLYYACLCGHIDVVRYLLEAGARCEANTFDGERCIYGALSPEIRHELKNFKVVSSQTRRREIFSEFLRRLLEGGEYADVCFDVHGAEFYAHKCILSSRSEYFAEMFAGRWREKTLVHVTHELVSRDAFAAVLSFMYTDQLTAPVERIDDIGRLAKQCKLASLVDRLDQMAAKAKFFQSAKPGTRVTAIAVEAAADAADLQADLAALVDEAIPAPLRTWLVGADFYGAAAPSFADVVFVVDHYKFFCHQAFFCSRSEYFRALLRDPLGEAETSDGTTSKPHCVRLRHFSAAVFAAIAYYIYQESAQLDEDDVLDVLVAADVCLLPGLKRLCGAFIGDRLDGRNAVAAVRTARMFELARLEARAYAYIADHLEQMIDSADLHALIVDDAAAVDARQDVDSIDVVDNVRFNLTAQSLDDAHDKLALIDDLLRRLDLEA